MSMALNATKDNMEGENPIEDSDDVIDVEATASEKPVVEETPKVGIYSWFVLGLLLAIRVVYQWHRSVFSYSFGYKGIGIQAMNPIYEIGSAYPELASNFGVLTGFAYTIPFAFMGLFYGKLASKVNRKWVLGIFMILSGLTMGTAGFIDSFLVLAASRFALGTIGAMFNPMSFSLLTDYFPPERRATANSVIQSGNYIGWGLSSISIILI